MDASPTVNPVKSAPKIGLKIERPRDQKIHGFFNFLLVASFLFVACTLLVLVFEYLHLPAPEWFQELIDNLSLIFF